MTEPAANGDRIFALCVELARQVIPGNAPRFHRDQLSRRLFHVCRSVGTDTELAEGLRDTARWIRAQDPNATNYIYCLRAAEALSCTALTGSKCEFCGREPWCRWD